MLFSDHKPLVKAFSHRSSQTIPRRARQTAFIAEFNVHMKHIEGSANFTADALSRVEINSVISFQPGIDYAEMSKEQLHDNDINDLLRSPSLTSLHLCQYALPDQPKVLLWCDDSRSTVRPMVPLRFRRVVFDKLHSLSHPGVKPSLDLLLRRFVWPGIKKDVKLWVKKCLSCQKGKITRHNIATLQSYHLPESRFRDINIDIVEPLPESNGFCYLLTAIDRYTRYVTAVSMKDATTESVVYAFLHGYVSHFGVPGSMTTDRGSQFESGMWSQRLSFLGCL